MKTRSTNLETVGKLHALSGKARNHAGQDQSATRDRQSLLEFAATMQAAFDSETSASERKKCGHFGTPSAIASFMAGMIPELPFDLVRVIDPGAGVGTLSAAICERALDEGIPKRLVFDLWENDPSLVPVLEKTMQHCRTRLLASGIAMDYTIHAEDFILSNSQESLFDRGPDPRFDICLLNPPYFKIRKDSAQAKAMEHVVHGQPNIYALFMALSTDLLNPAGQLVAITPRSYFNGPYFKKFRKWLFDRLAPRQIHVFESRNEAFKNDAVLQENVILLAEKSQEFSDVLLTTSTGRNFSEITKESVPIVKVLENRGQDCIVRVSTNRFEHEIIEALDSLPFCFRGQGYEISTGPVVTFRATEFLRSERTEDTAPLLWMHNVRPFITQFPPQKNKPTHITISEASRKLLVPAKTYILLKRFTSKEEKRRLVAGIFQPSDSYSAWIGLENHLNYVYRRDGVLSSTEAFGLAAYFNTALVDRYFRAISGSTQVNATEMRRLPVPASEVLTKIGEIIENTDDRHSIAVERIVADALQLSTPLAAQLVEAAE